MKPINVDRQLNPPDQPVAPMAPKPLLPSGFLGLRTKFVLLFSLILVIACSTLSWYYIDERREAMTNNLQQLGTVLLTSIVYNEHFQYAGLVAEDRDTLQQFIEGLVAVQDVVYVVITRSDGTVLAQQTKGSRQSSASLERSMDHPLYPDSQIAKQLYQSPSTTPLMTRFSLSTRIGSRLAWEEIVYDFAMPVLRKAKGATSLPPFSIQMEEGSTKSATTRPALVSGVVQIGLTDAHLKYELAAMIRNILVFASFIIGAGALGAYLLTLRITKPLRSLAGVAQQVAEGHSPMPLTPSTHDEIGQLTSIFNLMTHSLQERSIAITENLATIKHQVGQLTTLHQVSAAIAQTLDLNQILNTVLQLLIANLGFTRMVLMLRHLERDTVYVAQVAGVSPDIVEAARQLDVPIRNDGSLQADLLIHGKPLLISSLEAVADRMQPPILELARRIGVTSFVAVPLQSHNQMLGYLAADRGAQPCTDEDLHMLLTIASHVGAAIDNARAYSHLEVLTQHLEQRIVERTQELSTANALLQEQDRRRSLFLSVASHELRTPMTVIRSFADNMRDGIAGPVSEQQLTYLTRIGHNLSRLTRIVNQLLDWSRLDSEKDMLCLTPVCVETTALMVADSLRTIAAEKSITIKIVHADGLPAVQGDRDKLEQILWNLIGNAIKFTPPGGRITVSFQTTPEGFVQTCVADTGCGIDPGHVEKLFQEFSKVPSANPTAQGAQLGLFITKSLVTMHRGTIWVESTLGAGARFYFTVPVASSREDSRQPAT
ncbi:MAG TPA: ATP-binding protein [Nitrospiraceae bacterium]|jgi:signal transduction histidine kinase/HAMP domain-containing protein|nr:ATP-binding protein [Nitrospiraceae bacterium]